MERRDFIKRVERISAGAACLGLAPLLAGCSSVRYLNPARVGNRMEVTLAQLGTDLGVLIDHPAEGMPIYIHRHGLREFTAVLTRCMHQGCQAEPSGDRIACPCHGSQYTFRGEVLRGPTERPLIRYRVTLEGETIQIWLDQGRGS